MTPGPMLPHMEDQLLNDIELLLGQSDGGLTSVQLEEAFGTDAEVIDLLLWRTGRSRGLLYDGHFWRYGSAGDANPPVLGHSLPKGVRYDAGGSLTSHDPMCYVAEGKWDGGCQCGLIARVRAETLDKALGAVEDTWDKGYPPSLIKLLSAINALRGE